MNIWSNIRLNGIRGYWRFQKLNPGHLRADLREAAGDIAHASWLTFWGLVAVSTLVIAIRQLLADG